MKKRFSIFLRCLIFLGLLCAPMMARAEWWDLIISSITGMDTDLQNKLGNVDSDLQTSITNNSQNQINSEVKLLTGHSGYGNLNYDPQLMNWGQGSDSWESLVKLYQSGNSGVGQTMAQMSSDFPVVSSPESAFNKYTNNDERNIDLTEAQTALASRASSQVAFDKINQESNVLNTLNQEIEAAPNAKAAADLNNRLVSENSSINLQLEKLMAVMVQQRSIEEQGQQADLKAAKNFYNMSGN